MKFRALAASLLFAAAVAAQDDPAPAGNGDGRHLTKEQVAEQLEKFQAEVLPKCWSPKVEKDPAHRRKYLAKWQAVTSDHYIVFTDGPTATCKKYATSLEDMYALVKQQLPFADLDHLLVAYIFADPEDYYRFTVSFTGWNEQSARATAGHATSLYYATYYTSPTAETVFHEATHEIVGACLKVNGVGSWFQEGVAVYFQKTKANDKVSGNIKSDIKRGNWYPLAEFFEIQVLLGDPRGHGRRNYEHAGALLDFMVNTKLEPVAGKINDFFAAARKGRGFGRGRKVSEDLIQEVYGLTLQQFEDLWLEHVGLGGKH